MDTANFASILILFFYFGNYLTFAQHLGIYTVLSPTVVECITTIY